MGIIRKQSVLSSIFIYIGFGIGALNVLVLFPNQHFFKPEEFGLTRLLLDVSLLISMLCTFGSCPAMLKFYPFYDSYLGKKDNDLPFWSIMAVTLGCVLFIVITPFLKDIIIRKYGDKSPLFVNYFYLIYPLTISMAFMYLFEAYSWSLKKTVFPAFLREVLIRLVTTILIVLVMLRWVNFNQFVNLFSLVYFPPVILLVYSLIKNGSFSFTWKISNVTRRLKSRIIIFSLFIFSGQALNVLARTLDSIIISSQSKGGLKDTAVFTVAVYLVTLMEVPMRGMTGIATSMIAQAWKDKDMKTIYELYKKTALNLLIPGLGIMGLLLLNMHNAILFLGPTYKPMATVIVILGTAKIIDLGTGLNSQILLSSKHWKIDFISNMFLVFMAGIFNYLLVRKMGIIGSAYATLIAFTIYNFVRFVIIWKLFKMQPFTLENLKTIAIALICFLLCWLIPAINDLYLDVIVKSIPFMLIYGFLIIKANISKDINDLYYGAFNRIKRIF